MICTCPSSKGRAPFPRDHDRYSASGSGQRLDKARTKPAPQAPTSLQTWTITFGPIPEEAVASPITNLIRASLADGDPEGMGQEDLCFITLNTSRSRVSNCS